MAQQDTVKVRGPSPPPPPKIQGSPPSPPAGVGSAQREPLHQLSPHAPPRGVRGLAGRRQRGPAERAVEVEVLEPPVEARLVEDVAAPELAHLLALPHRGEAHHAVGRPEAEARTAGGGGGGAAAGGEAVLVEVVGEDDEAGEAGADEAGVDGGVGGGAVDGSGEAEGVEEGEEEGAEVADAAGDDGEEEEGDGAGGDVLELALQHRRRPIRVLVSG